MTAVWWLVVGAVDAAVLIRAFRPRFCTMLREEFFTRTPYSPSSHSAGAVDGSSGVALGPPPSVEPVGWQSRAATRPANQSGQS